MKNTYFVLTINSAHVSDTKGLWHVTGYRKHDQPYMLASLVLVMHVLMTDIRYVRG